MYLKNVQFSKFIKECKRTYSSELGKNYKPDEDEVKKQAKQTMDPD